MYSDFFKSFDTYTEVQLEAKSTYGLFNIGYAVYKFKKFYYRAEGFGVKSKDIFGFYF